MSPESREPSLGLTAIVAGCRHFLALPAMFSTVFLHILTPGQLSPLTRCHKPCHGLAQMATGSCANPPCATIGCLLSASTCPSSMPGTFIWSSACTLQPRFTGTTGHDAADWPNPSCSATCCRLAPNALVGHVPEILSRPRGLALCTVARARRKCKCLAVDLCHRTLSHHPPIRRLFCSSSPLCPPMDWPSCQRCSYLTRASAEAGQLYLHILASRCPVKTRASGSGMHLRVQGESLPVLAWSLAQLPQASPAP